MTTVILKRGRDKPVRNRHPWIFSGAVAGIDGPARDGEVVRIVDEGGQYLATGYLNRRSQIVVRIVAWNEEEEIDAAFWRRQMARAIEGRRSIADSNACRLVYAESDGLPGLIVDRYGDWLVMQCLTLGMAQRRDELAALLAEMVEPAGIYARDDADVRLHEGLGQEAGRVWGEEPPDRIEIEEGGYRFLVDVKRGHKTGFYLDQRENRRRTAAYCAGADVLNAFAYSGAFAVYAAGAGARSVLNVDSSIPALEIAEENLALNGLAPQEMLAGDVFQVLRDYRAEGRAYDVIVLDPPKFATSQADVMKASRGYKDLNLLAMQLLKRGGVLVTFSCSGRVDAGLFQKFVFAASVDAGRQAQIVEWLAQAHDHPVLLTFPESWYLKGFICRVW
ncbi:MAG: class I SAM-dependent rRNA methyltransferase [Anaerolineae bacterium]|nr:class I SAM-dependent rRNA methyltransferase [Anaerolineae bacterium]